MNRTRQSKPNQWLSGVILTDGVHLENHWLKQGPDTADETAFSIRDSLGRLGFELKQPQAVINTREVFCSRGSTDF
jgi:hypothetical protein